LCAPELAAARPIKKDDALANDDLGKTHGDFVFASRLTGKLGSYRISHRIVNKSANRIRVDYGAALLVDIVKPKETTEDQSDLLLLRPLSSAVVPGIPEEVTVYTVDGRQIVKTTANAYLPPSRVFKLGLEGLPAGVEWMVDQAGRVIRIITDLRGLRVKITSEVRPTGGAGLFSYSYRIENGSESIVYFNWTSVLRPGKDGWQGSVVRNEPVTLPGGIESGAPVLVNDVVALNTRSSSQLPRLTNLRTETELHPRAKDLDALKPNDVNTIAVASAIIPESWLRSA
jgi:hypothetical protein